MGDMIDILYYFPGPYREHNLWAAKINFRNPSRWQLVIWSFVHKFMSLSRCSHQNGILSVVFYSNLRDLHPWAQHIQLRRHYCLRRARMCNFFYPKCISFFNFTTLVSPLSSVLSNSPMYHIYLYPDVVHTCVMQLHFVVPFVCIIWDFLVGVSHCAQVKTQYDWSFDIVSRCFHPKNYLLGNLTCISFPMRSEC